MPLYGDAKREYQRQWVARNRAEFFVDKTCNHCGDTEDLELDHVDPGTKVSHNIWSWSHRRREIELTKCQVLCHFCHRMKTDLQFKNANRAHGTLAKYKREGCKCPACRKANAEYEIRRKGDMA